MSALDVPFRKENISEYLDSLFSDVELEREQMHAYQNEAVEFLLTHPYSALFIDLGLGKTCISLTAILNLVLNCQCERALVIAPIRVANDTWPNEIRQWRHTAPLTFTHIREAELVEAVNEAGKKARDEICARVRRGLVDGMVPRSEWSRHFKEAVSTERAKAEVERARILASQVAIRKQFERTKNKVVHIINREQVEFLVNAWGRDWPYDTVIIDESSCFKDHTTNRFKALKRVRPLIKRMHQLTATPAAETYLHLFPQIYLLDQGQRLGKSITNYRNEYFNFNQYNYTYTLKPGADEKIAAKIADITLTMKADDYLDLKKPLYLYDKVKLSDEQMALYKAMERDFVLTMPSGEVIEAETAAALTQKLQQIASGVVYQTVLEDVGNGDFKRTRIVHEIHDHKIEKLKVISEEAVGECLLVAYWHESSLARLRKAFPYAVVMDREGKCIKDWNNKKIRMLLLHPMSGGHGLNLQKGGRRIVFYDIPWSLELYQQFIGRLARQGQKFAVLVHHLIAEGTVDEDVVKALTEKWADQEWLFKLLKRLRVRFRLSDNGI